MSTLLLPIPRLQGRGLPSEWSSRILVAADGRESSDAAISMAWTLSRRSILDVVSVLKTSARGTVSEAARCAIDSSARNWRSPSPAVRARPRLPSRRDMSPRRSAS